jgi:glycosyltransferase involved in cell wall biosynthesis
MDVSGADDAVISRENGYISEDYTEFEDHLIELLENPGRAHDMGERGRDYMEKNFDYEQSLDKQVQIWEELSQEMN